MSDTKVKISHILDSQIPDFIQEDNPLFKEFLNQYYISQEREYGNIDLAENITDNKNISNFIDLNIVGFQALSPIILIQEITAFDDIINVSSTLGFPDSYGLLKIDNEIITYTGKTETSFTGCVRGFSAISALEKNGNPEFLTFNTTEAVEHAPNSNISNLSHIFLVKFYEKFKANYLPGVEKRNFMTGLSVENILSRAKDFYTSKGTDTALDILFQVLFGKKVSILKPFDDTITSSDAEWIVADQLMVEALEGNPINLEQTVIFQESFTSPTASGAVSNVEEIFLGNKRYHRISLSKGSIEGTFKVNNKTQVIGTASTTSVVTVDSTVGFSTINGFQYLNSSGSYVPVTYQTKSDNQFFGVNSDVSLSEGTSIIDNVFIFGYENNDTSKICKMRVMGAVSNVSKNFEKTKFFREDDDIKLKYLGEKVNTNDKKFNTWFYNNVSFLEIIQPTVLTNTLQTLNKHFLNVGDRIDILDRETKDIVQSDVEISSVTSDTEFSYVGTAVTSSTGAFSIKKRLKFASPSLGIGFLLSDIQNTFIDNDKNTYVAFSGYPSDSSLQSTDRSQIFESNKILDSKINLPTHEFLNGEKIYYQSLSSNSTITGITTGTYFVKVIDPNNIKLALNAQNLYLNNFIQVQGTVGNDQHKITPAIPIGNIVTKLENQNNFRRILKTPKNNQNNQNISGPIGLSLNGIEYHSPISNDSVFYGQIDDIIVLDNGNNYSVVSPPAVTVSDPSGNSAVMNAHVDEGQIKEIIVTNKGFDYIGTPSVTISGGQGRDVQTKVRMEPFKHSVSCNDTRGVDLTNNKITIDEDHRFLNGEEVTYTANGRPIGISAVQVGFSTNLLSNGGNYFISHVSGDDRAFKLHISEENAIAGINTIDFTNFGNNRHTFTSKRNRRRIAEISVVNGGRNFKNNKVVVTSDVYPPANQEDLFKTFVGVSVVDNCIYAKNHNFKNGDEVKYTTSNTAIGGLTNSTNYILTVINDHKFKLSSNLTNYNNKIYINFSNSGSGSHTFNYPDISVNISGPVGLGSTIFPSYYTATADPVVKGKISNIFIESGGVGYGVTDIVNYVRKPSITIETGKNSELEPVVDTNGEITEVIIIDGGENYSTAPEIIVGGSGKFAKLRAIVSNGKITSIEILNRGKGYSQESGKTTITAVPFGSGCILGSELHEWKLNDVERFNHYLTGSNKDLYGDTVQIKSETRDKGNKICSFYPPKELRKKLLDNLDGNEQELEPGDVGSSHSPILGWAYDGNPIYGSIGNAKAIPDESGSGGLKRIKSSYELINPGISTNLRPSGFSQGDLIDDYVYTGRGDLDEYNGRFIVNSDFPDGTYAYFSTVDSSTKTPIFPYITLKHKDATDSYNYDIFNIQNDLTLNSGLYKRNVTPLGVKEEFKTYPFLETPINSKVIVKIDSISKSGITTINVLQSGENYRTNELINFGSNFASAKIKDVLGKTVVSVGTSEVTESTVRFAIKGKKVTGFTTIPHNFKDSDLVEITGISSSVYKNIEGFRTVGVVTTKSELAVSIGNTNTTGINTFINLEEPTSSKVFNSNDIIKIEDEEMLITTIDRLNNRYNVVRKRNNIESAHNASSEVNLLPQQFTFDVVKKLENKNIEPKAVEFFDASFITLEGIAYNRSVGIGSTSNNIVTGFTVGTGSSTAIIDSSIPNSIFLPNHKFKTGDKLKLTSFDEGVIKASLDAGFSSLFDLSTVEPLICVKFNNNFIGLKQGSDLIFFNDQTTGSNHKIERLSGDVTGKAIKTAVTLISDDQHLLVAGDNLKLNISPNQTQEFILKYNSAVNKLIVNPVTFSPAAVGVGDTVSTITIANHDFKTGDAVIYLGSDPTDLIDPLVNNSVYHVIRIDDNTIRLADSFYSSKKAFPYQNIKFTDNGAGTHELSKINPPLEIIKGNKIEFNVSDSSLSGYTLNFYTDNKFKSRFNSVGITTSGSFGQSNSKVTINNTEDLSNILYYRIEGLDTKYTTTFPSSVYTETDIEPKVTFVESKFNREHRVTGVGSTTISFSIAGTAETTFYDSTGFSTAFYSSNSTNIQGGINSIEIINPGNNLSDLPFISSIGSTTGIDAVLSVESEDIGKIRAVNILDQGLELSNNKTLAPRADSHVILKLKNAFTLESVGIKTGGQNYTTPPIISAVGQPDMTFKATLVGGSVSKVDIVTNGSGFGDNLKVIPTVNSNGVGVINAKSEFNLNASEQRNTLFLRAPVNGFPTGSFPFELGDEIFVENVKILEDINTFTDGAGYNSSDYNLKTFTIPLDSEGIDTDGGEESISYPIVGLGTTGGTYDGNNAFGRVIKTSDLASFEPIFKKVKFLEGETITQGNASGTVIKQGWDDGALLLKLENVTGDFEIENQISGSVNGFKATIEKIFDFNFDLEVSAVVNKNIDWSNDKGKLNVNTQRLHDNDYYQRFSYSVKGEVPYHSWKEPIDSLAHVSGYKNFSDYQLLNEDSVGITTVETTVKLSLNVDNEASVHRISQFDFATEDTDVKNLSKIITFEDATITDYNESVTNKVLMIDDLSPQFTGISTTTGGNIVGLTTFTLLSDGNPLFIKSFNPATDINTTNKQDIDIIDHEFHTGERLIYSGVGNTSIGIVTTSVPGIGSTDILPAEVFPIKITNSKIKVAISTSNAAAGIAVTFTNLTGVGITHTLEVHTDVATNRSFITVDNVIQSPLARKILPLTLSSQINASTDTILLHDVSNLSGKDLIKINDEIIKINLVAIGATNSLTVTRGVMGTVPAAHTVGSAVTAISGDYRIEKGLIHFSDAPYGPVGVGTLTTRSSFSGRALYRLNYDNNFVIDDISESFNGIGRTFNLTSYGSTVTGIQGINTSFGAILINNIFQKPFYKDVGSAVRSDYNITGVGQTIVFTGAFDRFGNSVPANNNSTPRGGRIGEFDVGIGSGFQTPYAATANLTVSGIGTISAVGIVTGGGGYLEAPRVSIASTIGSGAAVTASITSGIVTALTITNAGTGYTATDGNLRIIIDSPKPYKNLALSGGTGSGAAIDVVVGTGGSVISFDMTERGIGYTIGDVLTLDQLKYNPGVSTLPFTVTVNSKFQDKFSGWTFGQLIKLDDFSNLFNGFRKTFLFTRTLDTGKEFYSIVAQDGSGITLANNLFIFVNDVLQRPNIDYVFKGGTRLQFLEAPKSGSKCQVYFYTGSDSDFIQVDVEQSVKPGDILQLQKSQTTTGQDPRIIYQLISADTVETQTYSGVGISTDSTIKRPVDWKKQTEDVIIDGAKIHKTRNYLEPQFYPCTNIIQSVAANDTKIYVANTYPAFQKIDDQVSQSRNSIKIVSSNRPTLGIATAIVATDGTISGITISDGGSGYKSAPKVSIQEPPITFPDTTHAMPSSSTLPDGTRHVVVAISSIAPFDADGNGVQTLIGSGVTATATASITSGIITSITVNNAGGGYQASNPPLVIIEPEEADVEEIKNVTFNGDFGQIVGVAVSNTGLNMASKKCIIFDLKPDANIIGDPGKGRSGIQTGDFFVIKDSIVGTGVTSIGATAGTTVAIGTAFIDNVFYAHHHVSIGSSILRVFSNVNSVTGINTSTVDHVTSKGNYSWGSIDVSRTPNSHAFEFFNQQGTVGIDTSAQVSRIVRLRTEYS